ncbi:hypothetical protein I79_015732 [Cricetulus griseus]|uniref:Uncharacterized protein n=1 Tax=Cricetulus griseus TaxID=10029 RepID=G3HXK7_CRIGR|nr:hypothetical protein I79_015732 [Cricetulus griseus]
MVKIDNLLPSNKYSLYCKYEPENSPGGLNRSGLLQASFLPSGSPFLPTTQSYSNLAIGAAEGTRAGELVCWVQLVHLQYSTWS